MLETERLSLKVLRRDKDALRRLAAAEGEAMAVVVRRLIRRAACERGLLSPAGQDRRGAGQDESEPQMQGLGAQ